MKLFEKKTVSWLLCICLLVGTISVLYNRNASNTPEVGAELARSRESGLMPFFRSRGVGEKINSNATPATPDTRNELGALLAYAKNRLENATPPGADITAGRWPADVQSKLEAAIAEALEAYEDEHLLESQAENKINALNTSIDHFMSGIIDPNNRFKPFLHNIADGEDNLTKEEFRAVWVATVWNLDWPSSAARGTTPNHIERQKSELVTLMDNVADMGANAVIFQVSPNGDALYKSELQPWSYWVTGEVAYTGALYDSRGNEYDPLAFAIELAHKRNIELHAWFNPYRINPQEESTGYWRSSLSPGQTVREAAAAAGRTVQQQVQYEWSGLYHKSAWARFPQYIYNASGLWVADPSAPEVRRWNVDRIMEIVSKYNVDAIHFDDYFYYFDGNEDAHTMAMFNNAQYNLLSGKTLSRDDWRRENVNMLFFEISQAIRASKPWVKLGISPSGVWRAGNGNTGLDGGGINAQTGSTNSNGAQQHYTAKYADTRMWIIENWIDYIAPQIYWSWNHNTAPYGPIADWWARLIYDYGPNGTLKNSKGKHTNTQLYIGTAMEWMNSNTFRPADNNGYNNNPGFESEGVRTFLRHFHYNQGNPNVSGSIIYSYQWTDQRPSRPSETMTIQAIKNSPWQYPALIPTNDNMLGTAPRNPVNVSVNGNTVNWTDGEVMTDDMIRSAYFVIYRSQEELVDIINPSNIVAIVRADRAPGASYSHTIEGSVGDYFYIVTAVNRVHNESQPPKKMPTPTPTPTPVGDVEGFVTRIYHNVLERNPDPNGLAFWANGLKTGAETASSIIHYFFFGSEFLATQIPNDEFIKIAYLTFMNRDAEENGMTHWMNTLSSGFNRRYVVDKMILSPEFEQILKEYGIELGPVDGAAGYVARMYRNVFDCNYDREGFAYWLNGFANGTQTGASIAEYFFFGEEFLTRNVSIETFVEIAYATFMNRDPDSAGFNHWVSALESGADPREVLRDMIASNEFIEICHGYGIDVGQISTAWVAYENEISVPIDDVVAGVELIKDEGDYEELEENEPEEIETEEIETEEIETEELETEEAEQEEIETV